MSNIHNILREQNECNNAYWFFGPDGSQVMSGPLIAQIRRQYFFEKNYTQIGGIEYFYRFAFREIKRRGYTIHPPTIKERSRKRSRSHCYINVYIEDRACGGPEEGGWWYDCASCVESVKVSRKRVGQIIKQYQDMCKSENEERNSDTSSVASEGRFVVRVEDFPGENYPKHRPRYE